MPNKYKIVAVVVTYNPDASLLMRTLRVLSEQTESVVVVDNASSKKINLSAEFDFVTLLEMDENYGLGYAQNIGIEHAIDCAADYVLLLDQDSSPNLDMVESLLAAFQLPDVAVAGPAYIDPRTKRKSFFVTENMGLPYRWKSLNASNPNFVKASFLIASGSLIKLDVIKKIGGKRSNYFIDHVDTEWTFRARAAGYRLIGVPEATMHHSLGDSVRDVWFFGWRHVSYHSPLRDYYMFRNSLLMFRDLKLTFVWKFYLLWRLMQFGCYFLVFSDNRLARFKKMSLGILHGVMNVRGKLNTETSHADLIEMTKIDP